MAQLKVPGPSSRKLKLGVTLGLMWALRWVFCLFAAVLILNYLSDSSDRQSIDEFANSADQNVGVTFEPPSTNIEVIVDMFVVGFAALIIVLINGAISSLFLQRIATQGNRLWALMALVFWPLFVVGCITILDPDSDSFAAATAVLAMPLDALLVLFIGRRIWLERSPFFNLGLIDYGSKAAAYDL